MFVSQKIVFLELQKTGCSHIRKILKDLVDGEIIEKHNQVHSELLLKNKFFLGSIRDPWEWYISLWTYGCDQKGTLFERSTGNSYKKLRRVDWIQNPCLTLKIFASSLFTHSEKWKRVYKDSSDIQAFREWLYMMHNKEYWNDFGEGFGNSPLSKFAGLLTYRYLKLFCCTKNKLKTINKISNFYELVAYENQNCFINYFIRNENLESNLFDALEIAGLKISSQKKSQIISLRRTNSSSRKYGANIYYDTDTKNLILSRERLIIEKFGYTAPR